MQVKNIRVTQRESNKLWYLQKRTWYGKWIDVVDYYGNKITDASWAGKSCNDGITGKADRWVFENLVKSNYRYCK